MKSCATTIFSKNRAMQLHLCLKSLVINCPDIFGSSDVTVLYKADKEHRRSYKILAEEFPQFRFRQEKDFKKDVLKILQKRDYVFFIVDDTVFTREFTLSEVLSSLDAFPQTLGFSLRLGRNCTYCYPLDAEQGLPYFAEVNPRVLSWIWRGARHDWGYPLEISSSVYHHDDVVDVLYGANYGNPNELESAMATSIVQKQSDLPIPNRMMCYYQSVAFSNPINKVQTYNNNRSGNIDPDSLNRYFLDGYRIRYYDFADYVNVGAHEIVNINLVRNE